MSKEDRLASDGQGMSFFERYLTVWVALCIVGGIALGKLAPGLASTLDGMAIHVDDAPVVSIPIALCLFFMMYPIMVKIDFAEVVRAGRSAKPVSLTLFVNWAIKPFTMYAIATFFLGTLFLQFIGPEATDLLIGKAASESLQGRLIHHLRPQAVASRRSSGRARLLEHHDVAAGDDVAVGRGLRVTGRGRAEKKQENPKGNSSSR